MPIRSLKAALFGVVRRASRIRSLGIIVLHAVWLPGFGSTLCAEPNSGLNTTFAASGSKQIVDCVVTPNVWLYVPHGQSVSPFLPVGPFDATWTGTLSVNR